MRFLTAPQLLASAFGFIALVSCSTTDLSQPSTVVSIEKPSASLAGARTYAWYIDPTTGAGAGSLNNNSQFAPAVQAAVERELESRGYRKAVSGSAPDLRIAALLLNRDSESKVSSEYYFGGQTLSDVQARYLTPGASSGAETMALILDGRDPRSGDVWWRGSVTTEVNRSNTPEQRHALLNQFIDDLFKNFPNCSS